MSQNFKSQKDNDLTVIVYNFVDMLSHSKTEMEVIKELASNDKAYRRSPKVGLRIPLYWKSYNKPGMGMKLIITTDHGTINVKQPSKVIGDKETSLNLDIRPGEA